MDEIDSCLNCARLKELKKDKHDDLYCRLCTRADDFKRYKGDTLRFVLGR